MWMSLNLYTDWVLRALEDSEIDLSENLEIQITQKKSQDTSGIYQVRVPPASRQMLMNDKLTLYEDCFTLYTYLRQLV